MLSGYSFYLRIKESLTEKIIFEKNSKDGERTTHAGVCGNCIPGGEDECPPCEAGACLAYLHNSREASVAFPTL